VLFVVAVAPGRADQSPPVTTLEGHAGWVGAVAFSPDGKRLATASADRTARTWLVDGGRPLETLKGHTDYVCAVAFGPDGVVVTGGYDGAVRLWRPKEKSKVLETRRGAVMSVALSSDGKVAAAGGLDGVVTLLYPSGEKKPIRLTGHKTWVNSLSFDSGGRRLASGSSDGTARLWDVKRGKEVKVFTLKDPREIRSVALSSDGKLLAAGLRFGAVKVWDVAAGKEVADLRAHEGDAWAVCFTRDGKTLVSGGGDWGKPGAVRLWQTKTWTGGATLTHPSEVLCVAVSPDGRWVAAGGSGKTVSLWDVRPQK
jgi:WD40 repeat protein